MLRDRITEYTKRTGDYFAINVLAKACEAIGAIGMAHSIEYSDPQMARASAGLIIGGLIVDKLTGGLKSYNNTDTRLNNQ